MTADERLDADWLDAGPTRDVIAALEAARPGGSRFVGGCVRNALMGLAVEDIDIATRLRPEAVISALEAAGIRAIPTGLDHGTVTAVCDGDPFEITTLRRDVETDGRRAVIAFTEDWAEDAARRDFRLNALYADPCGRLHDPTGGGIDDARAGRVVFIGDADTRLKEDYLRILRFFRFNAWYGAGIDPDGLAACARQKAGLSRIAAERVWKEVKRLLGAPDPARAVEAMAEASILEASLPGARADGLGELVAAERRLGIAPDAMRRLMVLLAGRRTDVQRLAARLRFSRAETARLVAWAKLNPADIVGAGLPAWRAAIYRHGAQAVQDSALVAAATGLEEATGLAEGLALCSAWQPPRFTLGGADAKAAGLVGPEIGAALRALESSWVASDFTLDRAALLARLNSWPRSSH